jgi:amidohydrolase
MQRSAATPRGGKAAPPAGGGVNQFWKALPAGAQALPWTAEQVLAAARGDLIALRRHIHAHPELSGQEFETANLVERELKALGLEPRRLPRGNGVLCDLGAGPGDRLAIRADMDALALSDVKDVPYRSRVAGACHACGHDVHTTILLGTARVLAELEALGELPRPVRLIFQPAEEIMPSGAPEVIEAGGLDGVSSIFALHCYPHLEVGHVGVRHGALTAAADFVEITLTGAGGHTARPHLTGDLVNAMGRVATDLPALLSRRIDARANPTMVFGAAHAGDAANAIPMAGVLRGTMRVTSVDVWRQLPELVPATVHDILAGSGVQAQVDYRSGVPPVINDPDATARVSQAAVAVLNAQSVHEAEASMGGEDFSFYTRQVPGSMFRLGVAKPGTAETSADIHQPAFDVDERAIACGVRVFTRIVLG